VYDNIGDIPPAVKLEQPVEDTSTEGGFLRYMNAHLRNEIAQAHHELDMLGTYRPELAVDRTNSQGYHYTILGRLSLLRDKLEGR
jgi:hypothetical protein